MAWPNAVLIKGVPRALPGSIDDAFERLKELARRQQELAQQGQQGQQAFEQRWQQEQLRREAEEMRRQMESSACGCPTMRSDSRSFSDSTPLISSASMRPTGIPVHPETTPPWLIVRYKFPQKRTGLPSEGPAKEGERGAYHPPLKLTWYDGGKRPALVEQGKVPDWRNGVLFVGDKGMLLADYGRRKLLPEDQFAGFQPAAPFIPNSIGHHKEWIEACKAGGETTCNFDYSGALAEAVLLGSPP